MAVSDKDYERKVVNAAVSGETQMLTRLLNDKICRQVVLNRALCMSEQQGHVSTVRTLIIAGADVRAADIGHVLDAPLRWAAEDGKTQVVDLLLQHKANVHTSEEEPLRRAIEKGHDETVKLLLDHKANIDCNQIDACLHKLRYSTNNWMIGRMVELVLQSAGTDARSLSFKLIDEFFNVVSNTALLDNAARCMRLRKDILISMMSRCQDKVACITMDAFAHRKKQFLHSLEVASGDCCCSDLCHLVILYV